MSSRSFEPLWRPLLDNPTTQNLDQAADMLRELITDAAKHSTPELRITSHSKRWWSDGLKALRTDMQSARKRHRNFPTDDNHIKYKADRNTYYSACRHAQVTTWKKMLTDAKGKDIWTVFRYTQPRKSQISYTRPSD